MRSIDKDVPKVIGELLEPVCSYRSWRLTMERDDLIITGSSEFDFDDLRKIAEALGIGDIDLENPGADKIDIDDTGCETCGYGSRVRVYGARRLTVVGGAKGNA